MTNLGYAKVSNNNINFFVNMEKQRFSNIKTEEATKRIARDFASRLKKGDIVLLEGNLGAGKTFFVKEAVKSFAVDEAASPTFSIVNEYDGNVKIYHFDFYRIKKERELYDIGIDEYLSDEEAITFIEWAELFPNALPEYSYLVKILLLKNGLREITISKKD